MARKRTDWLTHLRRQASERSQAWLRGVGPRDWEDLLAPNGTADAELAGQVDRRLSRLWLNSDSIPYRSLLAAAHASYSAIDQQLERSGVPISQRSWQISIDRLGSSARDWLLNSAKAYLLAAWITRRDSSLSVDPLGGAKDRLHLAQRLDSKLGADPRTLGLNAAASAVGLLRKTLAQRQIGTYREAEQWLAEQLPALAAEAQAANVSTQLISYQALLTVLRADFMAEIARLTGQKATKSAPEDQECADELTRQASQMLLKVESSGISCDELTSRMLLSTEFAARRLPALTGEENLTVAEWLLDRGLVATESRQGASRGRTQRQLLAANAETSWLGKFPDNRNPIAMAVAWLGDPSLCDGWVQQMRTHAPGKSNAELRRSARQLVSQVAPPDERRQAPWLT